MDWLANFFWTPAELAFAVPLGVLLAGLVGYLGARKGSKDLAKSVQKQIDAQRDLVDLQREHVILDKQTDAYIEMIRVLQKMPGIPANGTAELFAEYNKRLIDWNLSFQHAHAPLLAFAIGETYQKVQPLGPFMTKCTNMISHCIVEMDAAMDDRLHSDDETAWKIRSGDAYKLAVKYEKAMVKANNILLYLIRGQLFPRSADEQNKKAKTWLEELEDADLYP